MNVAAISTMMLLCRVLDGVTDLVMGGVIDKTRSRWGKARPWLLVSAPLILVATVLVLNVPLQWADSSKLVYVCLTYIFLNCIAFTIFGVSHAALLSRLSSDTKERTNTAAVSGILNNLFGYVIAGAAISVLQINYGWRVTSIVLGVSAGTLILFAFLGTREQVGQADKNGRVMEAQVPMKKALPAVLKNRYFYILILVSGLGTILNANFSGSMIYYCKVVLEDPGYMAALMGVGQLPMIAVLFLMPYISNKFSNRTFMLLGVALLIIGTICITVGGTNRTLIMTGVLLKAVGISPTFAGVRAVAADIVDYGEWKTGMRTDGLINSSMSFGQKIGIGLGTAITGWIIAFGGYNAAAGVNSAATVSAVKFAFGGMNLIIAVLLFISLFSLNIEKRMPQIHKELEERQRQEG